MHNLNSHISRYCVHLIHCSETVCDDLALNNKIFQQIMRT